MGSRKFTAFVYGSRCAHDDIAEVIVGFETDTKRLGGRLGIEVISHPSARIALDIREEEIETIAKALTKLADDIRRGRMGAPNQFR